MLKALTILVSTLLLTATLTSISSQASAIIINDTGTKTTSSKKMKCLQGYHFETQNLSAVGTQYYCLSNRTYCTKYSIKTNNCTACHSWFSQAYDNHNSAYYCVKKLSYWIPFYLGVLVLIGAIVLYWFYLNDLIPSVPCSKSCVKNSEVNHTRFSDSCGNSRISKISSKSNMDTGYSIKELIKTCKSESNGKSDKGCSDGKTMMQSTYLENSREVVIRGGASLGDDLPIGFKN